MKRYRFVWRACRRVLGPWVLRKFNCTLETCTAEGPLLVLANHNTDWDPLLIGCAFPNYMSFVASEHIFRWGFLSKVLNFLVAPIARLKGTTAGDTALTMMRRLRKGGSVAMFAEGNRSFNGLTNTILPATGKLARGCGATLVTYRFDGGYFSSPRWAGKSVRRGRLTGKVVNIYSPEQLKAMSTDEVNEAICRDLYVDAYAVQREQMIPFVGKNLAEGLETVLCRCPKCGAVGTLSSAGDTLSCVCGFSVKYNEYGFFEGEDAPFDNLTDWDQAQTKELCAHIPADGSPIFADTAMSIVEILPDHSERPLGCGDMALHTDRLEICGLVFPLDTISGFSIHGPQTSDFTAGGKNYEISSEQRRCTRKYMLLIDYLRSARLSEI